MTSCDGHIFGIPTQRRDIFGLPIQRSYIGTPRPAPWRTYHPAPEDILPAAEVLAQIDMAMTIKARVLLVTLSSDGGNVEDGFAIYNALREFSSSGGIVVAYACGWVASTATYIALAADYLVFDKAAVFIVHSMIGDDVERMNRRVLDVYKARTFMEEAELLEMLSRPPDKVAEIGRDAAIYYGWADLDGDLASATRLAIMLAEGKTVSRRRRSDFIVPLCRVGSGDGYTPRRLPAVTGLPVLPGSVPPGTVSDTGNTRGGAVHNMWPNATSELSPPDGADATTAEWAGRVNAGTGAYAGSWVRQLGAAHAQRQILGDQLVDGTDSTSTSLLSYVVPCVPNDAFWMEAMVRWTQGTAGELGGVRITFFDKTDAAVGFDPAAQPVTLGGSLPTTWTRATTVAYAPAGSVKVRFSLWSTADAGGSMTAQFDSIIARRQTEASGDSSQVGTGLTVAAGGNTWTTLPGAQVTNYTPVSTTRRIKVTLHLSGYDNAAPGLLQLRIFGGGAPVGVIYPLFFNTITAHQSSLFVWTLAAGTFGPPGTIVSVLAQIISPTGSTANFVMDANDSSSLTVEEIG